MNTETLKEQAMQRLPQHDPDVPEQVGGIFFMFKMDMAVAAQQQPEMSDDEVLAANHALGGFNWLDDPKEDVY